MSKNHPADLKGHKQLCLMDLDFPNYFRTFAIVRKKYISSERNYVSAVMMNRLHFVYTKDYGLMCPIREKTCRDLKIHFTSFMQNK